MSSETREKAPTEPDSGMAPLINLYAEFLLNIRQATIYATLEDDQRTSSDVIISSDKKTITVTYEDVSATVTYPTDVSGTATVEFPTEKRKVISLRLEIEETDDKPSHGDGMDVGNDSPWPASSFSSQTRLACRSCEAVLVEAKERTWKDLPREHWAELMDLWHCHKPHTESEDSAASSKGYSASNRPRLREGLCFVDTCYIFIASNEVQGFKTSNGGVSCMACNAPLGANDDDFGGLKLYKWSLLLQREPSAAWEQNAVQNFVCAQILSLIDSQATKKFVAFTGELADSKEGILLWAFNPDLKYSASFLRNGQPRRAMKILYKASGDPRELLEKEHMIEELHLPSDVLSTLQFDLDASNKILPPGAQTLQGWAVALLDRFDPEDAIKNG